MSNINPKHFLDIKIHVENYCLSKGGHDVNLPDIFDSKPDMIKLYSNPISFGFEQHIGPVYSIDYSPFHRNLFLTGSLDGSIKVYEII